MKILALVVGLIGVIACGNTFGGDLNLICTGEEFYPRLRLKSPYSFKAMIDLASNRFTIQLEKNIDNKKALYPRDNPWDEINCPIPMWKFEITDTELRIITACDESSYKELGGQIIWEIKRTDFSFSVYALEEELARGKCVESSERAF